MKGFKGQARASSKLSPRAFFHKPQTLKCSLIFFTQNLHESTWRLGSLSETTDRDSSLQAICTPDSVSGSQGRSQGQSWTGSLWSSCTPRGGWSLGQVRAMQALPPMQRQAQMTPLIPHHGLQYLVSAQQPFMFLLEGTTCCSGVPGAQGPVGDPR